jgi:tRNA(adenine34) deaminase
MDETFMLRAIALAREASQGGEPPFGALVVDGGGNVVSEASDEVARGSDFTLHAEVTAVRRACAVVGRDLGTLTLYTTVEPCPMCFTAAWLARVSRIVFGCSMLSVREATKGTQRELLVPAARMNVYSGEPLVLDGGVLSDACLALFQGR